MNELIIANKSFPIKIAISQEEQQKGLMHEKWPPPMMAFLYKDSSIRNFWMKDTPSPLDIVFASNNKIIRIENGKPYSLKKISSVVPCDLVLEFPKGTCKNLSVGMGDSFEIK